MAGEVFAIFLQHGLGLCPVQLLLVRGGGVCGLGGGDGGFLLLLFFLSFFFFGFCLFFVLFLVSFSCCISTDLLRNNVTTFSQNRL